MHAPAITRYPHRHAVGLPLTLALLASITLVAATLDWPDNHPALLPSSQARLALRAKEMRFAEAKMAILDEAEATGGAQYVPFVAAVYLEPDLSAIDVDHLHADERASLDVEERVVEDMPDRMPQ